MIVGFRILSLVVFLSTSVLLMVHLMQPAATSGKFHKGPSLMDCALPAAVGGLALLASKSVRSANRAFLATTLLLMATVWVVSTDRLHELLPHERAANSMLPILLSVLVLTAALLPLRPSRMFGLATLVFATTFFAALNICTPFQMDSVEIAGAVTIVAVSVATAARATSNRIDIHRARAEAI